MDKDTQESLVVRLNWVLGHIQVNKLESAEREVRELLKEVKGGIVVPF